MAVTGLSEIDRVAIRSHTFPALHARAAVPASDDREPGRRPGSAFLVEASLQSSSDGQRMRIVVHDTG